VTRPESRGPSTAAPASPNAGWPMAAMAGALGVGLAKRGAYRLGEHALPSSPDAIRRARRVLAAATAVTVLLVTGVALSRADVRHGGGHGMSPRARDRADALGSWATASRS
jgi:hypothetical protein